MMIYQIEYAYTSHIGKVRANNEDNFWCCGEIMEAENQGTQGIRAGKSLQSRMPLLAVFDGMGGESRGEMAAYCAAQACGKYYHDYRSVLKKEPEEFLEALCRSMNRAVCDYSEANRIRTMGTTVSLLAFDEENAYACNLGDSRLYQSDGIHFRQISTDHVLKGGYYGKAPLTQYVGIPEDSMGLEPSIVKMRCSPGIRYLLCSDGMTDMLSDGEIADILAREIPVSETVEVLLERVLKKGGRDNVTIVLCEVREPDRKNWFRELFYTFKIKQDHDCRVG